MFKKGAQHKNKYHVQHVNQTGSGLKKWLEQFNGVSTKYLQQYLNWFAIKKQIENASIPLKTLLLTVFNSYEVMQVLKKYTESKIYLIIHNQIKQ